MCITLNNRKMSWINTFPQMCVFVFFFTFQDTAGVFQVNVCVFLAGRARPATVPTPPRAACQTTAWSAAAGGSVCAASAFVTTPGDPESSVRNAPSATTPVNRTGNRAWLEQLSITQLTLTKAAREFLYLSKGAWHQTLPCIHFHSCACKRGNASENVLFSTAYQSIYKAKTRLIDKGCKHRKSGVE